LFAADPQKGDRGEAHLNGIEPFGNTLLKCSFSNAGTSINNNKYGIIQSVEHDFKDRSLICIKPTHFNFPD
jgi:hypothetical protein